MTYNYFPDEINTNDVMKMRFELADTNICALYIVYAIFKHSA